MKRHSGTLATTAQETISAENGVVAFEMCASKNITLVSEKVRVTEKAVRAQFFKALSLFEENEVVKGKVNTKKQDLVIGRIFFFWSLESDQDELAIYNISVNDFGTTYHYVNTKTLTLGTTDRIKPIAEKFGIGYYYLENQFIDIDKLNNMVIDAKLKEKKAQEQKAIEEKARQKQQSRDIAKGKELVSIPSWAKCVIVADLYQNDSDCMTDYFSTSVIDTVYLGFSKSTRNNMNELKQHSLLFDETKNFANEENHEQTDGGSYAPSYYLGSSRWGGWKVNKRKYFDLGNEHNKNQLFEAVGKGKFVNNSFLKSRAEEK